MLNIPSHIKDPFYRYKMPVPNPKPAGSINRTRIINLETIAKALRVPPLYLLKFLGFEFGCQVDIEDLILKKSLDDDQVRKSLDKFIEKYVLCPNCKFPETVLTVQKGNASRVCNACGTKSGIDQNHKMSKYIINNPPTNLSELADVNPHFSHFGTKQQEIDSDTDEEEEKKREESIPIEKMKRFKDLENILIEKAKQVYQEISKDLETFDNKQDESQKMIKMIKDILPKEFLDKATYVVFNAIFDRNIAKNIRKNKYLLLTAYKEFGKLNFEFDILLNLEILLLDKNSDASFEKFIPTILKLFCDEELLNEEFLVEWAEGRLNAKLIMDFRYQKLLDDKFKAASKPFLDWIRECEEEEEEDEEDNEENTKNTRVDD